MEKPRRTQIRRSIDLLDARIERSRALVDARVERLKKMEQTQVRVKLKDQFNRSWKLENEGRAPGVGALESRLKMEERHRQGNLLRNTKLLTTLLERRAGLKRSLKKPERKTLTRREVVEWARDPRLGFINEPRTKLPTRWAKLRELGISKSLGLQILLEMIAQNNKGKIQDGIRTAKNHYPTAVAWAIHLYGNPNDPRREAAHQSAWNTAKLVRARLPNGK